ncbi:MAG: TIGR02530 family flagellar biosynthesis protein [Ethanoligenens sp.]
MSEIQLNNALLPPVILQTQTVQAPQSSTVLTFSQTLEVAREKENGIHFSKHALERLADRKVTLASSDMQKLNSAVDKAAGHGLRDSLVLLGGLAFIVDVPEKTVVTAMQVSEKTGGIFTNIDGAVIA